MTNPIPEGMHNVNISLTLKDSKKALEFYKKALNAKVLGVMDSPKGGVMHAVMKIGDTTIMMGDEGYGCKSAETLGSSPISLYVYTENSDALFDQAVKAGGKVTMPMGDMFWGDRMGAFTDPFGYTWNIATQKRTLNEDEIKKGAEAFFASMGQKH
jgi:PhnB protein